MGKMRFRFTSLFLIAVILCLLLCTAFMLRPIDGFFGAAFLLFFDDATVWADAYSDNGFRAVRVGMSRSEVINLLGTPLVTASYPDGRVGERWTKGRSNLSYRRREVIFKENKAVEIVTSPWID
jgi:hypothetical protein